MVRCGSVLLGKPARQHIRHANRGRAIELDWGCGVTQMIQTRSGCRERGSELGGPDTRGVRLSPRWVTLPLSHLSQNNLKAPNTHLRYCGLWTVHSVKQEEGREREPLSTFHFRILVLPTLPPGLSSCFLSIPSLVTPALWSTYL